MEKLPSERHFAKSRPVRNSLVAVAGAALIASGIALGPILATHVAPQPSATATAAVDSPMTPLTDSDLSSIQRAAEDQQATILAEQKAADEAAAKAAAKARPAPRSNGGERTNLPAGAVPPNIPGTDQPDSTACASSALTWDGSQSVCA